VLNDVIYQASTNAMISIFRQNTKTIQVGEPRAWILIGNTANWGRTIFDNEVDFTACEIGFGPVFCIERRVLGTVLYGETKPNCHILRLNPKNAAFFLIFKALRKACASVAG